MQKTEREVKNLLGERPRKQVILHSLLKPWVGVPAEQLWLKLLLQPAEGSNHKAKRFMRILKLLAAVLGHAVAKCCAPRGNNKEVRGETGHIRRCLGVHEPSEACRYNSSTFSPSAHRVDGRVHKPLPYTNMRLTMKNLDWRQRQVTRAINTVHAKVRQADISFTL
jgi:hypothetical protein